MQDSLILSKTFFSLLNWGRGATWLTSELWELQIGVQIPATSLFLILFYHKFFMLFRKGKAPDATLLLSLYRGLTEFDHSLITEHQLYFKQNWTHLKDLKDARKRLSSSKSATFFAEVEGKVAGFISGWYFKGLKFKEGVFDVYVSDGFRGQGVGSALIKKMIYWFKGKGCKVVDLYVYPQNVGAKKLYGRLGFELDAEMHRKRV